MDKQADLFSIPTPLEPEVTDFEIVEDGFSPEPIAVPCGWRDRSGQPCRRLGSKPVMMGAYQFTCRGHRLVHCAPKCFSVFLSPEGEVLKARQYAAEDLDR